MLLSVQKVYAVMEHQHFFEVPDQPEQSLEYNMRKFSWLDSWLRIKLCKYL